MIVHFLALLVLNSSVNSELQFPACKIKAGGGGGKVLEPQPEKGPSPRRAIGTGLSYFHLSVCTFLPALNVALLEGESKC